MPDFQKDVLESKKPVMVKVGTAWCAPCKAAKPILDAIEKEFEDKLKIIEFDAEENPEVCQLLQIKSVPVLALYKDGELQEKHVGSITNELARSMASKLVQ